MTTETCGSLKPYLDYREKGKDFSADLEAKRRRAKAWLESEKARKASSNVVPIK